MASTRSRLGEIVESFSSALEDPRFHLGRRALEQEVCAEKSNEIAAIPELLKKIDVRGGVVTIDAMGAQKAIAEEVIRGGADYVLALKANHESLHRAVIGHIDERLLADLEGAEELTTTDRGHGREEERTSLQLPAPDGLPGEEQWECLKSVGVVTSRRVAGDKESIEIRYYLSSLAVDAKLFARAVRGHWSVENACPNRKGCSPQNACLRVSWRRPVQQKCRGLTGRLQILDCCSRRPGFQ
jgi:predicted transposase YbfD/YdcC